METKHQTLELALECAECGHVDILSIEVGKRVTPECSECHGRNFILNSFPKVEN